VRTIYKTFFGRKLFSDEKTFRSNNLSAEKLVPNEKICLASEFYQIKSAENMLPDEKNPSD
jgi:hypothetical protein